MRELQELALNAHLEVENQTSGCIVCRKLCEQVLEETNADC